MTEIEQKALALVNEVYREDGWGDIELRTALTCYERCFKALCRAIEQHEAFRREVSDAMIVLDSQLGLANYDTRAMSRLIAQRFIIPKPVDPLVEVVAEVRTAGQETIRSDADIAASFRAAMKARGYEFTKIGEGA